MKHTILAPLKTVFVTLIIAGLVLLLGWLFSGLRGMPDPVATIFLAFPFAIGIVTVQDAFRPVIPLLFLAIHFVLVLFFLLVPPLFELGDGSFREQAGAIIPDPPFTAWSDNEVLYARSRVGRELHQVVVADRTLRQNERARLAYDDRRFVPEGVSVGVVLDDGHPATRDTMGGRVLTALGEDIRDSQDRIKAALDPRSAGPFTLSESFRDWVPRALWDRWYAVILIAFWSFALVMVWTPARATRWPLLNLALVFVYLRMLFALPRRMDRLVEISFIKERISEHVQAFRLPLVLLVLVLVMVIVAVILPKVDRRGTAA